jgi:hypothetical protein
MTTYQALRREISAVQAARDSLPTDTHIGALFDFTIRRLWEHAEATAVSATDAWEGSIVGRVERTRRVRSSSVQ